MEAPKPVEMTEEDIRKYRNRIFDTIQRGAWRGHFIVLFADRKSMFWIFRPAEPPQDDDVMVVTLIEQDTKNLNDWYQRVVGFEREDQMFFAGTHRYDSSLEPEEVDEPEKKVVTLEMLLGEDVVEDIKKRAEKETFFAELEHKDIDS